MAGVKSKLRQVITPMPDADPLSGPTASVVVRYLASFAMTAVATAVPVPAFEKVHAQEFDRGGQRPNGSPRSRMAAMC